MADHRSCKSERYEWTADQRAMATHGSSVVCNGERRKIGHIAICGDGKQLSLLLYENPRGHTLELLSEIDPSSLRAPSLEFIQQLARERLNADSVKSARRKLRAIHRDRVGRSREGRVRLPRRGLRQSRTRPLPRGRGGHRGARLRAG